MDRFIASLVKRIFRKAAPAQRGRSRPSCRLNFECLEERLVPSLVASQVLPLLITGNMSLVSTLPSATTTSVSSPTVTFNGAADQIITLTANIGGSGSGTPNGGTVNFTIGDLGVVTNVPVVNGIAQASFTILAGTPPGTFAVTATFSGTTGFTGSSGASPLMIVAPDMGDCGSPQTNAFLGTAARFAVLAGTTVTNTGPTSIIGDVGVSPGTAVTGFPPGSIAIGKPGSAGVIHSANAVAIQARNDAITAFNNLAGEPTTANLTGQDLGGLTLTAGVYRFNSTAQLTGTLTLDAQGNPNARFVFQIGSTLTTASGSVVRVINGGLEDNIFWQVGSSATLGTTTMFQGNIIALASITLNTRASIECGRALAITGAVTLDTNFIDPVVITPPAAIASAANPGAASVQALNQVQVGQKGNASAAKPGAAYIQALYQVQVGQKASAQDVAYWERVLNGPAGRKGLVEGIEFSVAAREHLVQRWYEQYVGRRPVGGEEKGLVNLLLQGRHENEVLSRFFVSPAFTKKNGTSDEQFFRSVYFSLMKRVASHAEIVQGIKMIAASGRLIMAQNLLDSQQFRSISVKGFYREVLGRQTDAVYASNISSHLNLEQIRMSILESDMYWAKVTK